MLAVAARELADGLSMLVVALILISHCCWRPRGASAGRQWSCMLLERRGAVRRLLVAYVRDNRSRSRIIESVLCFWLDTKQRKQRKQEMQITGSILHTQRETRHTLPTQRPGTQESDIRTSVSHLLWWELSTNLELQLGNFCLACLLTLAHHLLFIRLLCLQVQKLLLHMLHI